MREYQVILDKVYSPLWEKKLSHYNKPASVYSEMKTAKRVAQEMGVIWLAVSVYIFSLSLVHFCFIHDP